MMVLGVYDGTWGSCLVKRSPFIFSIEYADGCLIPPCAASKQAIPSLARDSAIDGTRQSAHVLRPTALHSWTQLVTWAGTISNHKSR